jgi:hypothetical protein
MRMCSLSTWRFPAVLCRSCTSDRGDTHDIPRHVDDCVGIRRLPLCSNGFESIAHIQKCLLDVVIRARAAKIDCLGGEELGPQIILVNIVCVELHPVDAPEPLKMVPMAVLHDSCPSCMSHYRCPGRYTYSIFVSSRPRSSAMSQVC